MLVTYIIILIKNITVTNFIIIILMYILVANIIIIYIAVSKQYVGAFLHNYICHNNVRKT